MPTPKSVIIDTDMAIDDWMAMLYLLRHTDIAVKAITVTGAGEAHCAPGVRNALNLVAFANQPDIPVTCGRETPLAGERVFPQHWRDSVDSLAGMTLPESVAQPHPLSAVELITHLVENSADKMTILVLGPATNLAEWVQARPDLIAKLDQIVMMGGAFRVPGNTEADGIENPVAEWNIYVDPLSLRILLESGAPVTFVPLDATNHAPVTPQFFERLTQDHTTPEADFVFQLVGLRRKFMMSGDYYFWDPLAAVILTNPEVVTFEQHPVVVDDSGQTRLDPIGNTATIAVDTDSAAFEQLFLDALNGRI